jgi:menaquinone-dependent protoporphyrinogen oxidase
MHSQNSRREFVEIAAASFGVITLTCSGVSLSDVSAAEKANPVQPRKAGVPTGGRILVAYASRCGSTVEIAQAVGRDLQSRGYRPEIVPVARVSGVGAYQAVLLGSAVRAGNWLPEATGFVRQHRREIQNLPNAFFTVHMMNFGDDEKSRNGRRAYLNPIRELVRPDIEVFFAGRVDLDRLSFGERLLCRIMGGAESRDLRNWPAIHAWGSGVFNSGVRS